MIFKPGRLWVIAVVPLVTDINNGTWFFNGIKGVKGLLHHCGLLVEVEGLPQGVAKRPAQKNRAGRLHLFSVSSGDGNADGGDTGFFDGALDQSYGLITNTSAGCQQHTIDPGRNQFGCNFGRFVFH
jgi:hypothetical protein